MLLGATRRRSLGCQNWTKLVIIGALSAASIFSQTFTQVTTGPLVTDGSNSANQAWGDYDNDGDLDLFVPTYNAVDLFYQNNGDGTFSQITVGALVQDVTRARRASWGDYDNDGYQDLFVAQVDNWNNSLYQNNRDGTFTKITVGSIVNDGGASYLGAWADYDLDGDLDLVVVNYNQSNFLYRNNGDGSFTKVTNNSITEFSGSQCSWADYDDDGDPDILIQEMAANRLFRNNGDGSFTQVVAGTIPNTTGGKPAWGDYDNDGDLDVFIATGAGHNGLYRNEGSGNFIAISEQPIVTDDATGSMCGAWADFDNDGWLDLYVVNNGGGANSYYHNNGDGSFTAVTDGAFVTNIDDSYSAAAVDIDNDGDLDLFVSNYSSQHNQLYLNDGNANHWLAVDLAGQLDNTTGLTATIRLKAGNEWQVRQVLPTDGAPLRAHFGLGSETTVDSIVVEWPQGSSQTLTGQTADQTITMTQDDETPRSVKLVDDPTLTTNYNAYAIAWGDYDNDSYPDLFVPVYNDVDRLYHNNGDGTFSQITTGALVTTTTRAVDADWGDYDNDGYPDLFIAQTDNWNNALYRNNGDGTFTQVTDGAIAGAAGYSQSGAWWDYDRDGDLDLYLVNANNQVNQLFRNNGDGSFTNLSGQVGTEENAYSYAAVWGDYNNDGAVDLFVVNDGNNFLFRNNGVGSFTRVLTGDVANDVHNSRTASWGDYNNDGFLDLFVGNLDENNVLYRNNTSGGFVKVTTGPIATDDLDVYGSVWMDIDQDGDKDLYVTVDGDVNNVLYRNLGDGTFERVLPGTTENAYSGLITDGGRSLGVAVADIDRNGTLDFGVANYTGTPTIYTISPTGNNWLALDLMQQSGGTRPIGGRITTTATIGGNLTSQVLDIGGKLGGRGSSYQNSIIGLGDATTVSELSILWPRGQQWDTTNVAVNQSLAVSEPTVQTLFEKVVGDPVVQSGGNSIGLAWGDYNRDGYPDLFVANYNNANNLFHNNGDGSFSRITTGDVVSSSDYGYGGTWGDYDNDGYPDLYVVRYNQTNALYHNNGDGSLSAVTGILPTNYSYRSMSATWGDYDNDGDLDLFIANEYNQVNELYNNDGQGLFSRVSQAPFSSDQEYSSSAGWIDYDLDGDLDLFVTNFNGQANRLYRNNGAGSFQSVAGGDITSATENSYGGSWGDYDNDGDPDLFVANDASSDNGLYRNNGDGTFTRILVGEMVTDRANSRGSAWLDVDGDGDLDLFVNNIDVNNALYLNQGDGSFQRVAGALAGEIGPIITDGGASYGAAFADYDGNGTLDMAVANYSGENNFLYKNNGGNSWVAIRLHGTASNRQGIGARVEILNTIDGESRWQWRQVTAQSGHGGQPADMAHFGLGADSAITQIRVSWPSGVVWDTSMVTGNRVLDIWENAPDPLYTRVTDGAIATDAGQSYGANWGDYDNDGYPDLHVANTSDVNFLYHNNGDGTLSKITTGDPVANSYNSYGAAWGDYDNDGDLDLLVANYGYNRLYQNDGSGNFSTQSVSYVTTLNRYTTAVAWGDYDNDGDLDLYVANYSNSYDELLQNNGDGSFTQIYNADAAPWTTSYGYSSSGHWVDVDGDNDLDLFVTINSGSDSQTNRLYINQSTADNTVFTQVTSGALVNEGGYSTAQAWGDYDNDGDLDLFVVNTSEDTSKTRNFLYRNNGNGNFTKITTGAIVTDKESGFAGHWGDLDGDGWLDLVVGNSGANALYHNNGDGTFTRLYAGMGEPIMGSILTDGGLSRSVNFVDYNLDGDEDIFVVNQGNANVLYQHNPGENSWLRVQARGTRANYFADGSLVRVKATIQGQPVWQMREITSQTGGSGSGGLTASFGLGNATRADSVVVVFPNGAARVLTDVSLNRTISLDEPEPPIAAFTMDRSFGAPPFTVQFTDSSEGIDAAVVSWHWDFGDGETSTQQNPSHTYDEEGSYTVKLTIADANGSPASVQTTIEVSHFTDVTAGDMATLSSYSYSASWGDYDNDGDEDLFVANYSNRVNWLFRNDDGVFTWIESTPFTEDYGNTYSGHWGDADNDGDLDLLILNTSSYGKLYINQGNGSFYADAGTEITDTYFNNPYDAAWGDMDGDGDLDLIVVQYNNYPVLFENVDPENLEFERIESSALVQSYRSYTSVNFVDYDDDGDADCFFTTYGANYLYINVGDSLFVAPDNSFNNETQYTYGQAWGDYDNDGDPDLYLANYSGINVLYRNDGDSFTKITSSEVLNGNSYSYTASWVDLNNDGWLDLWVSNYGQDDDYFQNDGDGTFTQNTSLDILSNNYYTYQSVFADYDGNGSLDIFSPFYQSSTHNTLNRNNGNSNHWSTISLRGRESNRFGMNAKIRVLSRLNGAGATWQMREVGAGGGGYGENSLVAHFGLGGADAIDSLIVEWPNGLIQAYGQLPVDTKFTITESSGPPPELSWTPPFLESIVVGQNQTWSTTVTLFNTGEGALVYDISVTDSWLSADPGSGEIPAGDSVQVTLEIDADDLSQGAHAGQFTLYTNDLDEAVTPIPVLVQVATYAAFFDYSPPQGFAPLAVQFTDQSISVDYTITQWHWDFGDGNQSTTQNPPHTYTAEGEYPVTLTITNAADQTAQFTSEPVRVIPTIAVDFVADETQGGNPLAVSFTDLSVFNADTTNRSWTWDFGDDMQTGLQNPGHTYTAAGSYTVSLTVSDGINTYTVTKPDYITVINYPNFELSVTSRDTVDMEIVENDVSADTLMVYNPGGLADLEFGTSESIDWLSVTPASGTVPPDDSLAVALTFSSNDLGTYAGTLRFFANDENATTLDLPVTMHVVEYPYLPEPFRAMYDADGSTLSLTWRDRSRIEDGYRVYKQNGTGDWVLLWSAPANAVEYTDTAVDTNQTFRYRIRSFLDSRGESADAIEITVPAKPQLASISRNGDVVTLTPASTATGTSGLFAERWKNDEPPVIGGHSTSAGSVRDTINFGFADRYQYRVFAYGGSPTGSYGQSWPSATIDLPAALHGDYTGDDQVDVQDAIPFVNAWLTDNYTKETGPVAGTAPDFAFNPDGAFDSYDMAAFVGMYRYSAANLSAATLGRMTRNHPENIQIRYEPDETGVTIRIIPSATISPKALSIWLAYPPASHTLEDYQISGLNGESLQLEAAESSPANLAWIDMTDGGLNASGSLAIMIRLNHMDGGDYTSDVTVTGALLDASGAYIALNRTSTTVVYTPDEFVLEPAYPNPFNPTLHVKYGLPEAGKVSLHIYDIRGRRIATLLNQQQAAGWYTVNWDGRDSAGRTVATGIYFIRAQAAGVTRLQKVVFLK